MTVASGFGIGAAVAQDSDDEIVITGSRIARDPNATAPVPIQSVDAEDIKLSGEFSLTDVVNDIPALIGSTTTESSVDSAFAAGANILNLRGLGSARTLTLVDGRRHVGGVSGSSAVDIGSIPAGLVERVEVLTGGASAVYGSDAVTGVVNFILKDDFEGLDLNFFTGRSGQNDGEQYSASALYGKNFADGRGNITLAFDIRKDEGLRNGDRDFTRNVDGPATDWVNPALRFQIGDITAANTPNFAQFYNFNNTGLFNYGLTIPSAADFIADYEAEFGTTPTLTAAEQALIDRAQNAPPRAILPGFVFSITSGNGLVIPGNPYTFAGFDPNTPIDLDGNGTPDCLDSFVGYNSVFGAASFGVVGGCWQSQGDGTYLPYNNGLVAGNFNGFGGDSVFQTNNEFLIVPEDKVSFNLTTDYDLNDNHTVFFEGKYSHQKVQSHIGQPFFDLLFGAPDNPFIPDVFQDVADANGGIAITVDPMFLRDDADEDERTTYRFVGGIEGTAFKPDWRYEISAVYGKFERENTSTDALSTLITDRFFAAIDAVIDPATGQAACRVDVDPSAVPPTTPFDIPVSDQGVFSFTPGAGQCVPLNIWAGRSGVTQEALDFVLADNDNSTTELEQTVISGFLTGDTEDFFTLPAGAVDFAVGAEYRDESASATFSDLRLGVLPTESPFAGQNIRDVSTNSSLLFRPNLGSANSGGSYDVIEGFVEVSVPLLADVQLAEELTVDGAVRVADYSNVGMVESYRVGFNYVPVEQLRIRGTLSQTVRAPNISELFDPEIGTTYRPDDPCDASRISSYGDLAANVQANCIADLQAIGVDPFDAGGAYVFQDPLSAAFGGITSGNSTLTEETSDSYTIGFVAQPSFIEGLTFSADYWNFEIEDAIRTPSSQQVVDTCYTNSDLTSEFCSFFTRNGDSSSLQFGGFNFLRVAPINYAAFEVAGIDFAGDYKFSWGENDFNVRVQATKTDKIDTFTDPVDGSIVDPELGEIQRPEWAGNVFLDWSRGDLKVGWQTQYIGEQGLRGVEVETGQDIFGDAGFVDETYLHDLSVSYTLDETTTFYGGVRNVTDEEPYITEAAYPASPRGRYFFVGVDLSF
jgi:outer membrane receptor protein involved in Fe transport